MYWYESMIRKLQVAPKDGLDKPRELKTTTEYSEERNNFILPVVVEQKWDNQNKITVYLPLSSFLVYFCITIITILKL